VVISNNSKLDINLFTSKRKGGEAWEKKNKWESGNCKEKMPKREVGGLES